MIFFKFDKNNEEHCALKYVAIISNDGFIRMGLITESQWGNGSTSYNIKLEGGVEIMAHGEYVCPVVFK